MKYENWTSNFTYFSPDSIGNNNGLLYRSIRMTNSTVIVISTCDHDDAAATA